MKVFLDTVGCRLNQAEIEQFARQFRAAGHSLSASADGADLAVFNTCAVTAAAASDSRQKIRQAFRMGTSEIIATGCWATLMPEEAGNLGKNIRVVPNLEKDDLVSTALQVPRECFDLEPVERSPLPGPRLRTRAFIKVQDGCDNRCTFCVTTLARGPGRSRPFVEILEDIQAAIKAGGTDAVSAQEIVLTGVHLGSWGQDLYPPLQLVDLVRRVLRETDVPRLRLSSLEPWDLTPEFFSLWQDQRLCRHLHLPLQSGSVATLRRMARKTTPQAFEELVCAARQAIPGVAITTDVMTGFPGESEAEFEESLTFVEAMNFAGGHVFTYSARPGTAAVRMPGQVREGLRKERNARMRNVLALSASQYQAEFIDQVLTVLWESASALGPQGWQMSGLTDNYLRVRAVTPRHLWNQITPVRLIQPGDQELIGVLV